MTPHAVCAPLLAAAAAFAVSAAAPAAVDMPPPRSHVYVFHALLDDKPIGDHTFTVVADGATRHVTSEADFVVKFLGFSAYRYRHRAEERWVGDCLESLASTTDDDGKPASVRLERSGDVDRIATAVDTRTAAGCLMSYAYWNPALFAQTRLLNPQTGQLDAVRVERAGTGTIQVDGRAVAATRWRIVAPDSPIDVWVSAQGDWIGLDSMVAQGKHKLSYRL